MLYETAARASEILALNVEDLDLEQRRAPVRSKGGDTEFVYWDTGTAHLLPRLLRLPDGTSRASGPLFLASRRPVPARRPVPRTNLVPGSVGADKTAAEAPARSAYEIRSRMASFQRGVHEGRTAVMQLEEPQDQEIILTPDGTLIPEASGGTDVARKILRSLRRAR